MDKQMGITKIGYIGTAIRVHSSLNPTGIYRDY